MERIVALVDMDCFYVQVEQRANPELKDKPCAVVQYKSWKGGGIIAVGYEARTYGVTRQMRGDDARQKCPEIKLVQVPEVRGKADLTKYREAGAEVIAVFMQFTDNVERASIDEAYIDLTSLVDERMKMAGAHQLVQTEQLPNTYVIGYRVDTEKTDKENGADCALRNMSVSTFLAHLSNDIESDMDEGMIYHERRLAVGAAIVEQMRAAVYEQTGFRCSAGIAHNKVLAKLAAGIHKPQGQSILPHVSVQDLFTRMPIKKVRHFGGKFGKAVIDDLKVDMMADLLQYSEKFLQAKYGDKSGTFVYEMCRGFEHEPVTVRQFAKSVGCSKNFNGREALDTKEKVKYWLKSLCQEVEERLTKDREANKRIAKHMTVSLSTRESRGSRSCGITRYDADKFAEDAFVLLSKFNTSPASELLWTPSVNNLSVMAGKFVPLDNSTKSMMSFLTPSADKSFTSSQLLATQNLGLKSQQPMSQSSRTESGGKTSKGSIQTLFQQLAQSQQTHAKSVYEKLTPVASSSRADIHESDQDKHLEESMSAKKPSFFESFMKKRKHQMLQETSDPEDSNSGLNMGEKSKEEYRICSVMKDVVDKVEKPLVNNSIKMLNESASNDSNHPDTNSDLILCVLEKKDVTTESNSNEPPKTRNEEPCENGQDANDKNDMIMCDKCKKKICVWDVPEHADFHFALQIQKEQKQPGIPLGGSSSVVGGAVHSTKSVKRKSGESHGKGQPRKRTSLEVVSKRSQKLDRFFKKS